MGMNRNSGDYLLFCNWNSHLEAFVEPATAVSHSIDFSMNQTRDLSTATNCRWIELQEIRATRYLHLISRKWAVNQKPKVFPSPLLVTLKKLIGIMIYSLHISSSGTCTFQDVYCREDMRFWQISCCYKLVIKTLRRQQLFFYSTLVQVDMCMTEPINDSFA